MKRIAPMHLPRMRVQGLVIDELPDEVLVYDLERHKAHCLNRSAALVWQHCDGRRSAREIGRLCSAKLDQQFPEELVWLTLNKLAKLHLLDEPIQLPAPLKGISRRELVRRLGIAAAVAIPIVTSLIAPTPAMAFTCIPPGSPCNTNINCCSTNTPCVSGNCP